MLICETTNICNNDCIICPYGRMDRKKSIMPLELFEKVLSDYSAMGGGALSLTPMVGDVFLDKFLPQRIDLVNKYESITKLSVTSNGTFADRFGRTELAYILNHLDRIHISIYGLDSEEHRLMTQKDDYERVLGSIRAIIENCTDKAKIAFGFRILKTYGDAQVRRWITDNFHADIPFGQTRRYANWGGTLNTMVPLPFDAEWSEVKRNTTACLMPLAACQVYVNGDVSFCHCCDYNAAREFALGNVAEHSLIDILNGTRAYELWASQSTGDMPAYCQNCSFHLPLDNLHQHEYVFQDPIRFIGG